MIRVPAPVNKIVNGDQLKRDIMIISSPIRLGSGGRARFANEAANHQRAAREGSICIPRASSIVRL